MKEFEMIRAAENLMETKMAGYDSSHDALHVYRVRAMAMKLARSISDIDLTVVELAALFHDMNDHKYNSDDDESTKEMIQMMKSHDFPGKRTDLVMKIVQNTSYSVEKRLKSAGKWSEWHENCRELHCVQDADRLDAIGGIGILRAAGYSAAKNNPLYDEESKNSCYQHFYDKLLLLKDDLKTDLGRKEGLKRHDILLRVVGEIEREMGLDW